MSNLSGLENIAPAILRFPIEKTVKAIVNLSLGRKRANSICRLLALASGLLIGYNFPQIGNVMAFLISIVTVTPINPVLVSSISLASSMFLSAVVLLYLAKKSMQYYYTNKYGFSNSEYRFTSQDRKLYAAKYVDLSEQDYKKLITRVEAIISFLVNEINRFNITGQAVQKKSIKYVLNCVKRGNLTAFSDYYAEEAGKQQTILSARQQRLAKLLAEEGQFEVNKDSTQPVVTEPVLEAAKKDREKPKPAPSTKPLYEAKKKALSSTHSEPVAVEQKMETVEPAAVTPSLAI